MNKIIYIFVQNIDTFVNMTFLIGENFYDNNDFNKSSFFIRQTLILSSIFQ